MTCTEGQKEWCMQNTFVRGTSTWRGIRIPDWAANSWAAKSLALVNLVPSTKSATHRVRGKPFNLWYPLCTSTESTIKVVGGYRLQSNDYYTQNVHRMRMALSQSQLLDTSSTVVSTLTRLEMESTSNPKAYYKQREGLYRLGPMRKSLTFKVFSSCVQFLAKKTYSENHMDHPMTGRNCVDFFITARVPPRHPQRCIKQMPLFLSGRI